MTDVKTLRSESLQETPAKTIAGKSSKQQFSRGGNCCLLLIREEKVGEHRIERNVTTQYTYSVKNKAQGIYWLCYTINN